MKIETLKNRLRRDRPMVSVTLRMPEDIIDDLKRIAPLMGFAGYQPLIRAYVGDGLRTDLDRFDNLEVSQLVASLKKRGVSDSIIEESLAELAHDEATDNPNT